MNEKSKKFDMIAIGDTTQDIFLEMSDASVQCDLDGENCRISFDYADKIAVDKKTDVPAVGNAANHAIGAARLGLKTAIYTVVGDDVQGHLAGDVLKENKVDSTYLTFDKKNGTNFSAVINFKGERTILVYHEPREYQLPEFADTEWVYLTSASGDGVKSLHKQVEEYLAKNSDIKLSFNPGTHQMHLGREALEPLLKRTDVLFLNIQEAAEVLGVDTKDVKELVIGYHEIGVKNIVLTDGPEGSYVSDGSTIWYLGIFKGPVVERTGCGDSFGSGFMGAVIKGRPFSEAMLWGNSNSTSVVQFIGAREGLLGEDAVVNMIDENPDVRPQQYAKI